MREQTAAAKYRENAKRVQRAEQALSEALAAHAERQSKAPLSWGYVDDLIDVAEGLEEAVRFLGGDVRTYRATDRDGKAIRVTIPEGR